MKNNSINILKKVLICFAFVLLFNISVFSKNNFSNINMIVTINDDGSANITQKWIGSFEEGTENYIPLSNLDYNISNFMVEMNGVNFEYIDNWDIEKDFNYKKYKCGINKTSSNSLELCFGISSYGNNEYLFSYDIDKLVYSYDDKDGFNFKFINDNMSVFPTDVDISIKLSNGKQLTHDICDIWGFGFDGEIEFQNGLVHSYSKSKLYGSQSAIIMIAFDKDILEPKFSKSGSFEVVKNKAFVDSDYGINEEDESEQVSLFNKIIYRLLLLMFFMFPIYMIFKKVRNFFDKKRVYKESPYFREVPNGGDLSVTFSLISDYNTFKVNENNILSAIIMKMINDKNLLNEEKETVGFFGKVKKQNSLVINNEPNDALCKKFFHILKRAAGNDNVLSNSEFENMGNKNADEIMDFIENVKTIGRNNFNKKNGYKKLLSLYVRDLTDVGINELKEAYGLRKYLNDFTLISEREVKEITIWDDYLVYGTLFGVANRILKRFKIVFPEKQFEYNQFDNNIALSVYYNNLIYNSAINIIERRVAREQAQREREVQEYRTFGGGGSISFGGGGGFSGGGSGGGSR